MTKDHMNNTRPSHSNDPWGNAKIASKKYSKAYNTLNIRADLKNNTAYRRTASQHKTDSLPSKACFIHNLPGILMRFKKWVWLSTVLIRAIMLMSIVNLFTLYCLKSWEGGKRALNFFYNHVMLPWGGQFRPALSMFWKVDCSRKVLLQNKFDPAKLFKGLL